MAKYQRKEQEIENACKVLARSRGWLMWKNVPDGLRGIPDCSLMSGDGARFYLVEFKTDKGVMSAAQKVWQKRFPAIYKLVRNIDDFSTLLS